MGELARLVQVVRGEQHRAFQLPHQLMKLVPRGRIESHGRGTAAVWLNAWMTSARTNADWAEAARYGAKLFGLDTPAGSRLDKMGAFFAQLSNDMNGRPTALQLSTALAWPRRRVDDALQAAETYAYFTDPVVINHHPDDTYTVIAKPLRLSATQRKALAAHVSAVV